MNNEVSFECLKPHERDFFVSRISCGYYYFYLNGKQFKYIHPDKHIMLQANEIYCNSFSTCYNKTITEQEILELIIANHNWKYEYEEVLKNHSSASKDIKIKIFQSMYNPIIKNNLKQQLNELDKEYNRLYNIKNSFHYMTPAGIAESHKWCFIINNCVFNRDNKRQSYNMQSSKMIVNTILEQYITDSILRDLVKSEPWSSIWFSSGGRGLFSGNISDYNSEQVRIINWSRMYENIRKSYNPPSEDVMQDDDVLDGWMAVSSMERDKEKNISTAEGKITNKKIRGSQEVFVPVSSKEEAQHIQSLNTSSNQAKQKDMMQKLKGN